MRCVVQARVWDVELAPASSTVAASGGVLSNFPIRLIAEPMPEIMGNTDPAAALNFGLLLDEKLPVPDVDAKTSPKPLEQLRVVRRVSRLVDTLTGARDNDEIRAHATEICRLPVKGCGTTEFDMPEEKLKALVLGGYTATTQHLRMRGLARHADVSVRGSPGPPRAPAPPRPSSPATVAVELLEIPQSLLLRADQVIGSWPSGYRISRATRSPGG
jgi:hypothetical protein